MVQRYLHAEILGVVRHNFCTLVVRLVVSTFVCKDPVRGVNETLAAKVEQDIVGSD